MSKDKDQIENGARLYQEQVAKQGGKISLVAARKALKAVAGGDVHAAKLIAARRRGACLDAAGITEAAARGASLLRIVVGGLQSGQPVGFVPGDADSEAVDHDPPSSPSAEDSDTTPDED